MGGPRGSPFSYRQVMRLKRTADHAGADIVGAANPGTHAAGSGYQPATQRKRLMKLLLASVLALGLSGAAVTTAAPANAADVGFSMHVGDRHHHDRHDRDHGRHHQGYWHEGRYWHHRHHERYCRAWRWHHHHRSCRSYGWRFTFHD